MKHILSIIFLCTIAGTSLLHAQTLTKIAQIDGGAVRSLCANKFGDLYCTALNQVYRSIDQGQSWQKQASPVDTLIDLQLCASNDENSLTALFALAAGRVWKSTDDGQRWSSSTGLDPFVEAQSLHNLYATRYGLLVACVRLASSPALLRSRNNGVSFDTLCTLPAPVTSVVQAPDSSLYVMADRCYRVDMSGALTPIGTMLVVASYQEFFNAPVAVWAIDNNMPVRSTNKGAEWKSMKYDWKDTSGVLFQIIIDREANAYAFVRTFDSTRVYRLNNGSTSWTAVRSVEHEFREVLININGSFVASTDDGIYSSEDNGKSWTRTSRGISTYPISCAVAMENAVCVAGFDGELWQTNTGGLSWSRANIPDAKRPLSVNELIRTVKGKIIAATSRGIWVSADLGLNYIAAQSADTAPINVSSVAELSSGILVAASATGLFQSPDDGLNWSMIDSSSFENAFLARGYGKGYILSTTQGLLSSDSTARPPEMLSKEILYGRCAMSANSTIYTAGYVLGIPGTFPVIVSRSIGKMMPESISIPSTRTSSRIPVWVATGSANEAYVNTDAGLYKVPVGSTTPERLDVPNEVFTFVHSALSGSAIAATAYGGVYLMDVSSSVSDLEQSMQSVVPLPANDVVTIRNNKHIGGWQVRDVHGMIWMEENTARNDGSINIPVHQLPCGVYLWTATTPTGQLHLRFVVAR